jgi:acetyl-CoA acetyltransferase
VSEIVVEGVGMTPFGRFDDQTPVSLGVAAIQEALQDAGMAWSQVEAL